MEHKIFYLVTDGSYSDYHVIGIYSTPDKAEEAKLQYNADNDIEEFELNAIPPHPPGLFLWSVDMNRDGSLAKSRYHENPRRESIEEYGSQDNYYPNYNWSDRPSWPNLGPKPSTIVTDVTFCVLAKDPEHAIKIANEKRIQLIASNEWTDDYNAWVERLEARQTAEDAHA